jgi:hypothetical protein
MAGREGYLAECVGGTSDTMPEVWESVRAPAADGRTVIVSGQGWLEKKRPNKRSKRQYWYLRWRDYGKREHRGQPAIKRSRYIGPVAIRVERIKP